MKTISISDLETMEKPADGWFHIESNNDHKKTLPDKRTIIQVLDNKAMQAICEAGLPADGIPIDCDHRGVPGKQQTPDTAAQGWVKKLAVFDDGAGNLQLAGYIEWTPPGLELVQGKVYKHFSTVYDEKDPDCAEHLDGDRVRPLALLGLALTNNPNNWRGQRPITNSADTLPPHPADETETKPKDNTMEYPEKLLSVLGITTETPTDDEVVAAAEALAQRATAAESAAEEAAASEAETLLNSEGLNDLSDEQKDELKEGLVTNRALALMTIEALKARKSGSAAPRYAKGAAAPRSVVSKPGKGKQPYGEAEGTLITNRASEIQKKHRATTGRTMSFWAAKNQAKAELKREGKL